MSAIESSAGTARTRSSPVNVGAMPEPDAPVMVIVPPVEIRSTRGFIEAIPTRPAARSPHHLRLVDVENVRAGAHHHARVRQDVIVQRFEMTDPMRRPR